MLEWNLYSTYIASRALFLIRLIDLLQGNIDVVVLRYRSNIADVKARSRESTPRELLFNSLN